MLVKVETTTTKKLVDVTSNRVSLTLSEEEAVTIKIALEYLRNPNMWGEERLEVMDTFTISQLIETFEIAQVYADGVYV